MRRALFIALVLLPTASAAAQPWGADPQAYGYVPPPPLPSGPTISDRVAALDADIARVLNDIELKSTRKQRVEAEISGLGERRTAARRRLRSRARALYRMTRAGMLPIAGGFPALLGHLARMERLRRMVGSDARALSSLSARGDALRGETGELARAIEESQGRLRDLQARKAALEQEERAAELFGQQQQVGTGDPYATYGGGAYGGGAYGGGGSYGSFRVHGEPPPPQGFVSERGRLLLPVAGAAEFQQIEREDGPGLQFRAGPGMPVRAASAGRVAYADRYGTYGQLVILDHGDGYFTVYGGLGQLNVAVDQQVGRGATLGMVGAEGPPGLFFQVRRGTRAVDTRSWLGI